MSISNSALSLLFCLQKHFTVYHSSSLDLLSLANGHLPHHGKQCCAKKRRKCFGPLGVIATAKKLREQTLYGVCGTYSWSTCTETRWRLAQCGIILKSLSQPRPAAYRGPSKDSVQERVVSQTVQSASLLVYCNSQLDCVVSKSASFLVSQSARLLFCCSTSLYNYRQSVLSAVLQVYEYQSFIQSCIH